MTSVIPNTEPQFSRDHTFAAMCIWEEIVAPTLSEEPWKDYRDQVGSNELRDVVIYTLAGPCNDAWHRASARYENSLWDANPNVEDPGSFDWEFVPFWLRTCVDWSDILEGPRVRGNQQRTTVSEAQVEKIDG